MEWGACHGAVLFLLSSPLLASSFVLIIIDVEWGNEGRKNKCPEEIVCLFAGWMAVISVQENETLRRLFFLSFVTTRRLIKWTSSSLSLALLSRSPAVLWWTMMNDRRWASNDNYICAGNWRIGMYLFSFRTFSCVYVCVFSFEIIIADGPWRAFLPSFFVRASVCCCWLVVDAATVRPAARCCCTLSTNTSHATFRLPALLASSQPNITHSALL